MTIIGLISDTHGLLRTEAVAALRGADLILHAGDIGSREIVEALREVAPVMAVRGNCDAGQWAEEYPWRRMVTVEDVPILLLHDRNELVSFPAERDVRVVVSGHSHQPSVENRGGILSVNPGSAGRRRFKLPVTVALLQLSRGEATAEIVHLFP